VWLGGARQTRLRVGKLQVEGVPPNFEFRGSYVLAKICFTQPPTKTVSKHVTGNHEYSIYNQLGSKEY
jgi:hypothetical protein